MALEGFLKLQRSREAKELLKRPNEFTLLAVIALRAKRKAGLSVDGLEIGEALIGDCENFGLTDRKYRTAKARLKKWGFSTFKATSRGTVAKLTDKRIWDINESQTDEQTDEQATSKRRLRRNKECKEEYIHVFDYWLTHGPIKHKKLAQKMIDAILIALKTYSQEEIQSAIKNYGTVVDNPDTYFNHRWTLTDFLRRGLEKFLDEAQPLDNFLISNEPQAPRLEGCPECGLEYNPEKHPGGCPECLRQKAS